MNKMTSHNLAWLLGFVACSALAQNQDTTTSFTYDVLGNVKMVTRPLSRSTTYTYDSLSRMTRQDISVSSSTLTTRKSYDRLGQVASVTDPRNLSTSYTTDGLGNQTKLASPDTLVTNYTLDEAGNVLTSTDARGKTTRFKYDALGRLLQAEYQTGIPSTFEYDGGPGGLVSEIGNLTRITDESGYTTFAHDSRGRVLTKTQVVNAEGTSAQFIMYYSYGASGPATGKLESITYPSGVKVNYRYDDNGRVGSVMLNQRGGSSEVALLTNITYAPTGAVQSWQWGNEGLPTYRRTYDLDDRLTSYPTDLLGTIRTVSYNAASLVTAYSHTGGSNPAQYDQTFGYDAADRLNSFTLDGVTTTYTYDANGNRTQQTGPNVNYTYSASSNQLSSATFSKPRTYTYDTAGNRIGDGLYTYAYSDRGRLAQVRGSTHLDLYYNALGQRVLKIGGDEKTYYTYNEDGQATGEYNLGNTQSIETIYLANMPIAVITPQGYFYVLTDHINTPLVLEQSNGNVVWDWRNRDPFGNNAPMGSSTVPSYDHRFPGQIADRETGLYYNYFRDYDPQTGGYVQSDPIGLNGGINTYAYVISNPVSHTDSFGLQVVLPISPPPIAATPVLPVYSEGTGFKGPQYFWPKVIRDAASAIVDVCTGGGDECKELNNQVKAAKDKLGQYKVAACRPGMSKWDLSQRRQAWLDLASARAHRDQKCWEGGDDGHQQAQASAWSHVGNCDNLLRQ